MLLLLYKIFGMILQVVNEILIFLWVFKNRGRKNWGRRELTRFGKQLNQ